MTQTPADFQPSMSDEAVRAKTGKHWAEWFSLLDASNARQMEHKEIVKLLREQHRIPAWWCQTVTVNYEQARGLREKYQAPTGYQANGSKTIPVPVERLFAAWTDEAALRRWMPDPDFEVRKATPSRSLRLRWKDGSVVDVNFYEEGSAKSKVQLQHSKLANREQVERLKAYWQEHLGRLAEVVPRDQ